ncbi:MAG TPA: tRNA (N(6)-L-threonylcarbamoyladenosine(37)-C(2))-methylthiotransferase [Candidatus Bathyarchaeia archaeon]|nr:tRNA (N(6)-L-threonylcarbamoyladenosine(37)-C(2))-methylthiotransferase [Candidatus Bathyarchaeia archaeon]
MSSRRRQCRVFLESFGCSSNVADGEFMSGCLLEAGFDLVNSAEEADVLIYNTCAVKTPTENRAIELLKKAPTLKTHKKKLLVTGCLPLINFKRLKDEVNFDAVLGPSCGSGVVETLQKIIDNKPVSPKKPSQNAKPSLCFPRHAVNPVISIVPVAQGCLGSCSYCCVVFARGHLHSFSIDDVVKRIKSDLLCGAREVWLTGQDMGSYGKDIGVNLAELLGKGCALEGNYMVRVGMMTPNLALEILPDLVEAFRNEHVFKFVHLPVQSGDNRVLELMNREYSIEDFMQIVETFRNTIQNITVATDIICGFPGESSGAFDRTLGLIKEIKPDVVNISKFFPRPGTAAEKMKPKVSLEEVSERSKRATSLVRKISFEKNRKWLHWKGRILVDERGKRANTLIGRNFAYKPIVIRNHSPSLLGTFVDVKVTAAFQTYLAAEIVD